MQRNAPFVVARWGPKLAKFQAAADGFAWEVMSISARLEKLRNELAGRIGISGPQWMILAVLVNAEDPSIGLPVGSVSRALRVDQSFVVTQSKLLEKDGLLRRQISPDDARVVNLSLTEQASERLATLAPKRKELNEFIFSDVSLSRLIELSRDMSSIKARVDKAILKLAADL